jgi:hypothetical protein
VPSSSSSTVAPSGVHDVRSPTSRHLDGSDVMDPEPDCSAAYVVLHTDDEDGLEGHRLAFMTAWGDDVQSKAIAAPAEHVVGTGVVVRDGHHVAPTASGMGAQLHPQSLADHLFPHGAVWRS